jgi:glutathione synthase/RimK-type ligase-like ATP-grasp enzyme
MMVGELMAFFMEKHAPANGDIRWNEHRGSEWTRVPEDRELRRKVKKLGHEALKAIGYDFGACDIIMDRAGKLYVLEVNSRPEFEERNAERFAHAIASYLGG